MDTETLSDPSRIRGRFLRSRGGGKVIKRWPLTIYGFTDPEDPDGDPVFEPDYLLLSCVECPVLLKVPDWDDQCPDCGGLLVPAYTTEEGAVTLDE
jgi:hypothetical protein